MTGPTAPPDLLSDPEAWDYFSRHTSRKDALLASSQSIQDSCPKDPGHAHTPVSDCKVCHHKIVDLIGSRYLDSPETEWYADRRTFLQHLAELFPAVKRGEVDASGIEDRVMDEKKRWFRENVRKVAGEMGGAGMAAEKEELLRLLDDRGLKFDEFCRRVKDVATRGLRTGPPDGSLEKLTRAGNDNAARVQAYKEVFFSIPDGDKAEVGEAARKYLQMVDQGVPMTKVAAKIVEDRRQGLADQAKLERLQNRIEYLKKAQRTWLAQRKRGQVEEEKARVQPPCFKCGTTLEVADPPSCALCQVAVAHGILEQAVVYCSEECQRLGHEQHVAEAHKCASGQHCVKLSQSDDATGPSSGEGDVYLCKHCLEQRKTVTMFCSLSCAELNFRQHRQEVHPDAHGWQQNLQAHLVTVEQVLRTMQEKEVIDELNFVPKLPPLPVADRRKHSTHVDDVEMDVDNHTAEMSSRAETSTVTASTEDMEVDKATKGPIGDARGSPEPSRSIRRHDDGHADEKMDGVETQQPAPEHAADRNADIEMTDAVATKDFASQPQPVGPERQAPAAAAATKQQSPAATPQQRDQLSGQERREPRPAVGPVSPPSGFGEEQPPDVPAAPSQPSTLIVSPERITSIEPMPSLGRSLEIEIGKIPAGDPADPSRTDPQRVDQQYGNHDAVASVVDGDTGKSRRGTAPEIGSGGIGLDGAEDLALGRQQTGVENSVSVSVGTQDDTSRDWDVEADQLEDGEVRGDETRPDEAIGEREHHSRSREPSSVERNHTTSDASVAQTPGGSEQAFRDHAPHASNPSPGAASTINRASPTTSASTSIAPTASSGTQALNAEQQASSKVAGRPSPSTSSAPSGDASQGPKPTTSKPDESQRAAQDSGREEGEISDDSSRKRKVSMEPGEVDEDEDGRDVKKARSVDGEAARRRD